MGVRSNLQLLVYIHIVVGLCFIFLSQTCTFCCTEVQINFALKSVIVLRVCTLKLVIELRLDYNPQNHYFIVLTLKDYDTMELDF